MPSPPYAEPNAIIDGFQSLVRGIDSGRAPNTLARDQVAFAINATFRGGFAMNRPGWNKVPLRYENASGQPDGTLQYRCTKALFQGAGVYQGQSSCIIAAIGGRIFRYNVGTSDTVQDISISSDLNNPRRQQVWMEQAEDWLVIQDNQALPLFYNGSSLRRSKGTAGREIPTGSVMAYGLGRLWLTLNDGETFLAGDIVGGDSGTAAYNYRDAVLHVTENDYLNEGGTFNVPDRSGRINAMRFIGNLDTSTGQGPLQVFTDNTVFSVNAPVDRTTWKNLTSPIQTISLVNYGARAQNSTTLVNGDIWFRGEDGIRSFVNARREYGTWTNTPMSKEMNRILPQDTRSLLGYGSATLFDNRLLMTCSPYRQFGRGIAHRGLAVLDFDLLSSISDKANPAWEGIWTGLNILQILRIRLNNQERCFAFRLNQENEIELYELSLGDRFDNTVTSTVWQLETPAYNFQDTGWLRKELRAADLWYDRMTGPVVFTVAYKPDQYPDYLPWLSWADCAALTDCQPACPIVQPAQDQYRVRKILPAPPSICNTLTGLPSKSGYEFQIRLIMSGALRLKKFRIEATREQESNFPSTCSDASCITKVGCEDDLFGYQILSSNGPGGGQTGGSGNTGGDSGTGGGGNVDPGTGDEGGGGDDPPVIPPPDSNPGSTNPAPTWVVHSDGPPVIECGEGLFRAFIDSRYVWGFLMADDPNVLSTDAQRTRYAALFAIEVANYITANPTVTLNGSPIWVFEPASSNQLSALAKTTISCNPDDGMNDVTVFFGGFWYLAQPICTTS